MATSSRPSLKRPLVALSKVGYREITSILALSVVFWLSLIPVVTIGAGLLALVDVMGGIYRGDTPRGERERLRRFTRSVCGNLVRGLPLSALVLFVFSNTVAYFLILLSGQATSYLIGGLVGVYACLLAIMIALRISNVMMRRGTDWRTAARRAARSWTDNAHFTVLQLAIAALALVVSLLLPVSVLLVLPAGLALFELVFYEELTGTDPRTVLARYGGTDD